MLTNDVNKALDTKSLVTMEKEFVQLRKIKAITQQTLVNNFILNYYTDGIVTIHFYKRAGL